MTEQKLSPTMQDALAQARAHGGVLECWKGGFWTYPGCPSQPRSDAYGSYRVPDWYVGTQTLHALANRGLVEFTERLKGGYPIRAQVVTK